MHTYYITLLLLCTTLCAKAQLKQSPHDMPSYFDFINLSDNKLQNDDNGKALKKTFTKLETIELFGRGELKILHIGDSHIQAGFIDSQLRKNFQGNSIYGEGNRGILFPYKVARTNGPWDFTQRWSGTWKAYKNVSHSPKRSLGLSGITLHTASSSAKITMQPSTVVEKANTFSTVKVFHSFASKAFKPSLSASTIVIDQTTNSELGYTEFVFEKPIEKFTLSLKREENTQNHFDLYGFEVGGKSDGISLSSIGVNGAELGSWLRTDLLTKHIEAIQPDLIILSLGTNDCYPYRFNATTFHSSYSKLIERLKNTVPNCEFLLTTPGDHYRKRQTWNSNLTPAIKAIAEVAEEHNTAMWDFHKVMGGKNSIIKWKANALAGRDLLHYSRKGYELQGDLLYSAIMKSYELYCKEKQVTSKSEVNLIH